MKQGQKPCTKTKKVINRGKRSKVVSEINPVENINKNLQFSRDNSRPKGGPSFT